MRPDPFNPQQGERTATNSSPPKGRWQFVLPMLLRELLIT